MFLYNLLYIIYSKKPIFLALECLFRGDRGNAVWGLFCIFAKYKLVFVTLQTKTTASRTSASHWGGSLQRQFRSGSKIQPQQERSRGDWVAPRSDFYIFYTQNPRCGCPRVQTRINLPCVSASPLFPVPVEELQAKLRHGGSGAKLC